MYDSIGEDSSHTEPPLSVSESDLKDIFSFDCLHVERVKKIRDFAFIHYESRNHTEEALKKANGLEQSK